MKLASLGLLLLMITAPLAAQNEIPAGTILPVQLDTGLNTAKIRADRQIRATVMQSIPGTPVHRGAHVLGHVISVTPSTLSLRFDIIVEHGHRIPVTTNLRALASMLEVDQAQIPEGGADRTLPPDERNHDQIGGDVVYPDGGPVAHGLDVVGKPAPYGALVSLTADPPCRAAIDGNTAQQAVWVFSSGACGLYGFDKLTIEHAGRTKPVGTIRLTAHTGKINIRSGSGLLLRVQGS